MFRNVLSHPAIYLGLQKALGADRLRRMSVDVLGPQPGEHIVDVGCGPGQILDYLPAVAYCGFDTEPRYIDYARRRYGKRGTFYCSEFTETQARLLGPVNAVMLMGLLHHIPDDKCRALLDLVSRIVPENGRVITLDPCLVPGQSAISRFLAIHDRGAYARDEPSYLALAKGYFESTTTKVIPNSGRLPTIEIIMRLEQPKRQRPER